MREGGSGTLSGCLTSTASGSSDGGCSVNSSLIAPTDESTLDKELKDVHWLRLMYAYPSCFTDEMIRTIAECDRVVKYIDMPLQHINDEALKKMRRRRQEPVLVELEVLAR